MALKCHSGEKKDQVEADQWTVCVWACSVSLYSAGRRSRTEPHVSFTFINNMGVPQL